MMMARFGYLSTLLAISLAVAAPPRLLAQDAGGGRGPGGGRGRFQGGFPGGGFPGGGGFGRRGGGGFGGRGIGGPGGGNEFANINPADLVRRIDSNHDGVIETSEINSRTRPLLQRAGLKIDEPIANEQAIAAFEKLKTQNVAGGRFPGGEDELGYSPSSSSSSASGSAKKSDNSVPALVPSFGETADLSPVPGFGENLTVATASFGSESVSAPTTSSSSSSGSVTVNSAPASAGSFAAEDPKIRSYAMSMMKRYDKNGDGVLDKSEWSQMSGDPEKYDRNHDGKITLEEMIDGLKNWNRTEDSGSSTKSGASTGSAATDASHMTSSAAPLKDSVSTGGQNNHGGWGNRRNDAAGGHSGPGASNGSHYRTPKDRLPEGLPDWFTSSDKDGDGQVSLHEFASPLSEEKLAEFNKYDLNGDGFITPQEVLKVSPPKK